MTTRNDTMRTIIQLDGPWQIAEGSDPAAPGAFDRTVPVPGLVSLAQPPFAGTTAAERPAIAGDDRYRPVSDPLRDYFWYRRTVTLDTVPGRVRLRVAKAQFGLRVLVNGRLVGDHAHCFSAALLDISGFVRAGANEIVLRIGAHPAMLPADQPTGSDTEKQIWIPGVYDSVALWLNEDPAIAALEVAPDIHASCAKVRAVVRNAGPAPAALRPAARIREAGSGREIAAWEAPETVLAAGEERILECAIPITAPRLWSPDDPFLYALEMRTGGDSQSVRFGMRELRFDTPTRRAYLNDRLIFLRGSNITLHRFFEDPASGGLPWDRAWVRRLLEEWPKRLGWNCFRFCIGPVPDFWLDIADEAGLVIENEYFLWQQRPAWSPAKIADDVARWMTDCANHPSVGWWSLSNETWSPDLDAMIGGLRRRDLAGRAWNNGYYLPEGPDDPIDDHHYLFYHRPGLDGGPWSLDKFTETTGAKSVNSPRPSAHATILNEYGWLWLLRDGSPTLLTHETYAALQPEGATPERRIALCADLHAHETRHFRIHRNYAGVLHFTFLTADHPKAYTGDPWKDVARLEMWPAYEEAFLNSFQPVCAHIHYVRLRKKSGEAEAVPIAVINDDPRPAAGEIRVRIVAADGGIVSACSRPWSLPPGGQHTWYTHPAFPVAIGSYRVEAEITCDNGRPTRIHSALEIIPAG